MVKFNIGIPRSAADLTHSGLRSLKILLVVLSVTAFSGPSRAQTVVLVDPPNISPNRNQCLFSITEVSAADRSYLMCFDEMVTITRLGNGEYEVELKLLRGAPSEKFISRPDRVTQNDDSVIQKVSRIRSVCRNKGCKDFPTEYQAVTDRILNGEQPSWSGGLFKGGGIFGETYEGMRMLIFENGTDLFGVIIVESKEFGFGHTTEVFFFS